MTSSTYNGHLPAANELDLSSGGISWFIQALANDGMKIADLPIAVKKAVKSGAWSAAVCKRIEGIVRAHTRRLLSSRTPERLLESAVKAFNNCTEIVKKLDRQLSWRISAWADVISDVLYERDSITPERARSLKHVPEILSCLMAHGGWMSRSVMMKNLGIEPANMTRIMKSLTAAGLVLLEHHRAESTVQYCLSADERTRLLHEHAKAILADTSVEVANEAGKEMDYSQSNSPPKFVRFINGGRRNRRPSMMESLVRWESGEHRCPVNGTFRHSGSIKVLDGSRYVIVPVASQDIRATHLGKSPPLQENWKAFGASTSPQASVKSLQTG